MTAFYKVEWEERKIVGSGNLSRTLLHRTTINLDNQKPTLSELKRAVSIQSEKDVMIEDILVKNYERAELGVDADL